MSVLPLSNPSHIWRFVLIPLWNHSTQTYTRLIYIHIHQRDICTFSISRTHFNGTLSPVLVTYASAREVNVTFVFRTIFFLFQFICFAICPDEYTQRKRIFLHDFISSLVFSISFVFLILIHFASRSLSSKSLAHFDVQLNLECKKTQKNC